MTGGSRDITEGQFETELRSICASGWRLETRDFYLVTFEQDAYRQFLDGRPLPPEELPWWQEWLDEMRNLTADGKTIGRVRLLANPPTGYQRWELWGTRWHAAAGEQITYMGRDEAASLGIPVGRDWWLLDDERLVTMEFTPAGEPGRKTLITDPLLIAKHRAWRDLLVASAAPAEHYVTV